MRYLPTLPDVIEGTLRRFLTEILEALGSVLDCTVYKVRVKWSVPFYLDVPVRSGRSRLDSPESVRVARVNSTTTVNPGLPRWTWDKGRVRIDDIPGLTSGETYDITFEVLG